MATPAVSPEEIMYRQIPPGGNPIYFDPSRQSPVHRALFLPSREDTDGLSLIRGTFRSPIWSAFREEKPQIRFLLARFQAARLNKAAYWVGPAGLDYHPIPDMLDQRHGEPWAHCVATEINRMAYDSDHAAKKRIKEWALQVEGLVTNQDIFGPFAQPTEADSYRPKEEQ